MKLIKLKELREKNNYTQIELANKLKIEQNTYSNYENGKTQPKLKTLIEIADFYQVTLDYLLDRNINGGLSSLEYELLSMFRTLNEFEQTRVIEFVRFETQLPENLKIKQTN